MCITVSWVVIQQTLNLYVDISVQFIWAVVKPEEVVLSPLSPSPPPLLPPPGCCGPVPSLTAALATGGPFIESIELSNCRKAWIWGEGARFVFCGCSKLRQLNKTSTKHRRSSSAKMRDVRGACGLRGDREGRVHRWRSRSSRLLE